MSYNTLNEAQAIMDARLYAEDWNNSSESDKQKALNMAYDDINRLRFLEDFDPSDSDTLTNLKLAEVEIALARLGGADPEEEQNSLDTASNGFSSVRKTFSPNTVLDHKRAGIVSASAWGRLRQYVDLSREIILKRVS